MRNIAVALILLVGCASTADAKREPVDLDAYVTELAANHEHGEAHNDAPLDERVELLSDGGLESYCAEVAAPTTKLLVAAGYDARHIVYLALEPDEDGVHQGHHVVEVWHPERERWVVVDLDYGVMMEQTAMSTRFGRVDREPLEPDARDTEWDGGYPLVADGVGIIRDGVIWYNGDTYTSDEESVLVEAGWQPWPSGFAADFYG